MDVLYMQYLGPTPRNRNVHTFGYPYHAMQKLHANAVKCENEFAPDH
jgi:hypothetical protein